MGKMEVEPVDEGEDEDEVEDVPAASAEEFELLNAATEGEGERVVSLLDQGVSIEAKDENGDTLYLLACFHGHKDVAKMLIEQ